MNLKSTMFKVNYRCKLLVAIAWGKSMNWILNGSDNARIQPSSIDRPTDRRHTSTIDCDSKNCDSHLIVIFIFQRSYPVRLISIVIFVRLCLKITEKWSVTFRPQVVYWFGIIGVSSYRKPPLNRILMAVWLYDKWSILMNKHSTYMRVQSTADYAFFFLFFFLSLVNFDWVRVFNWNVFNNVD